MKHFRIGVIIGFVALLSACSSGVPPQEAVTAAFEHLHEGELDLERTMTAREHDVADFELTRAWQLDLNSRDEKRGIREKWCLAVDYVTYLGSSDVYVYPKAVYYMSRINNTWIAYLTQDGGKTSFYSLNHEIAWWRCLQK